MKNKTATHPSGLTLVFNPKKHRYSVGDLVFKGVTSTIENFFEKFDTVSVAKKYAAKRGLDYHTVIKEWEQKGDVARDFGHEIHQMVEDLLEGKEPKAKSEKGEAYQKVILKEFSSLILDKFKPVAVEKMVFSPKYQIAGTIDFLAEEKSSGDLYIIDWKTNKEIVSKPNFRKHGYGPVSHLLDCNFIHYSLQLNMYKKILANEKYYPHKNIHMLLIHITPTGLVPYKVDCLQSEVEAMLTSG